MRVKQHPFLDDVCNSCVLEVSQHISEIERFTFWCYSAVQNGSRVPFDCPRGYISVDARTLYVSIFLTFCAWHADHGIKVTFVRLAQNNDWKAPTSYIRYAYLFTPEPKWDDLSKAKKEQNYPFWRTVDTSDQRKHPFVQLSHLCDGHIEFRALRPGQHGPCEQHGIYCHTRRRHHWICPAEARAGRMDWRHVV